MSPQGHKGTMPGCLRAFVAWLCIASAPSHAASSIDPDLSFAWSENAGWITLNPDCLDGVEVGADRLSGYAWGENIGWINFGDGSNGTPGSYGVYRDGESLYGLAWGENVGWINFEVSPGVTIDAEGLWSGYAWGENIGWISFDTGYGVALLEPEGEPVVCNDIEGNSDGEGSTEGVIDGEGTTDGEGMLEGSIEGALEAEVEGILDGAVDGEEEVPERIHVAMVLLMNFGESDVDQSNTLDFSEAYRTIQIALGKGIGIEAFVFTDLDTNKDNLLTVGELRQIALVSALHAADMSGSFSISLSELLRVVQLYNAGEFSCSYPPGNTEDGYLVDPLGPQGCVPHSSDYDPEDWSISLSELLRAVQFYNLGGYNYCGEETTDTYCAGPTEG